MTFGDLVNFNPHLHLLGADGVFRADGTFLCLPPVPEELLREWFRRAVLEFLLRERAITDELRSRLLGWRALRRVLGAQPGAGGGRRSWRQTEARRHYAAGAAGEGQGPFHALVNFQVMPGAEWLELLCKHIPDRYEHLVRTVGWYSNRARGERAKALKAQDPATKPASEASNT